MVARLEVLNQSAYTDRTWIGMLALSVFCHFLFFSGVLFLPEWQSNVAYIPSAVEVDLVNLPQGQLKGQPPAAQVPVSSQAESEPHSTEVVQSAEKVELKRTTKEPERVHRSEKQPPTKKAESLTPKPVQVKRSLKKRTYDASRVITSAIAKIEKEAPKSRPHTVLQAIDELKKKDQTRTEMVVKQGASTANGAMSRKSLELLDIYNAEIWHHIQKNWAFSEEMTQGRINLEAVIIVKIMRDGKIRDIWFEERSGNTYFDDSALKAVRKSDPLPSLPDGFLGPYYDVGFRFNLSELKRRP